MPDEDKTTKNPSFEVREFGGRRIYRAQRLDSGQWLLVDTDSASCRTVTNDELGKNYEWIRRHDRQTGR